MKRDKSKNKTDNKKQVEKMSVKKIIVVIVVALCAVLLVSAGTVIVLANATDSKVTTQEKKNMDEVSEFEKTCSDGLYAVIQTSKGNIFLTLHYKETPLTCTNFVGLAEGKLDATNKKPFYDGLVFHRVIADFMIQGGCPLGNGTGGPGYQFPDEFVSTLKHNSAGVLSMANAGPNTNGSQFFITHVETPWLDNHHTVFGKVVKGQTVVDSIAQGDTIEHIRIIRKGKEAKAFDCSQTAFDALYASVSAENEAKEKKELDAIHATAAKRIAEKYPTAVKSETGMYTVVTRAGNGTKPAKGATVSVHYKGSLLSTGQVFDDSTLRGQPLSFRVGTGEMITGFDLAVADMVLGEKRTIILPPDLAYGNRSVGNGLIPANSYLVFEVELVKIQ